MWDIGCVTETTHTYAAPQVVVQAELPRRPSMDPETLRIVTSTGGVVSVTQAWLRYALAWPSVWLAGIGLWWALLDPDRQFLHDRLAGTRIILLPPSPKN